MNGTVAEAWYQSTEVVAALVGAAVAFFLVAVYDWLRGRRKRRSHFAALRAEMRFCHDLATGYLRDKVAAPLYRLPTVAYANSLPALLGDGALDEPDTRALLEFFNEVATLNRGLDQAEGARLIQDAQERDAKLTDEFGRNKIKAERLVSAAALSPTYYDRAISVVNSRMRWYRP